MWARKFILLSVLLLAAGLYGCGETNDTSNPGGSGSSTSSSGGTSTSTSSSGGTSTSTSSSGSGSVDPDPTDDFPSSGLPDQQHLTVLAETFNPRGRDHGNTIVPITVLLADQLGNNSTIPDGTQVYFAAAGGAIESSGDFCTTENGACAVNWRSQNPVPAAGPSIVDPLGSGEQVVSYSSGRATILVWTLGVESFIDNNSNGLFDDGDVQVDDVGDAFIDRNESSVRDNNEEFVDYPIPVLGSAGTYNSPDGLYSGSNCAHSTDCATGINAQSLFIFRNIELAMSSDSVCIVDVDPLVVPGGGQPSYYPSTLHGATSLTTGTVFTFRFLLHDCYGNPPMSGTTVSFSSEVGTLLGPTEFSIPNTNVDMGTNDIGGTRQRYPSASLVYTVSVLGALDNTDEEIGLLEVNVDLPEGIDGYTSFFLTDPAN